MHINWLGQTCIKLQTKNIEEDVTVILDPYKPAKGDFPRSLSPQIALFSHGKDGSVTLSQDPFVMESLGEVELKGVMIYAMPGPGGSVIFKLNIEGMNIVHLGGCRGPLDTHSIEKIGSPDILFIPVGGGDGLDAESAAKIVNDLEPRVVVPIAYRSENDPGADPVENFIKESGLTPEPTEPKVIIKKKDLPQEERKIYVLEQNY